MPTRTNYPALAIAAATLLFAVLVLLPLIAGVMHATQSAGSAL